MTDEAEKLQRLSELSEQVCALSMLAAKMEPVGEELEVESQPSPYDDVIERPVEEKARDQARASQLAETGTEMLRAVNELREMADRVERLISDARSLAHHRVIAEA